MQLGAHIVQTYDLFFDAGDKANGSLYLCFEAGAAADVVETVIEKLRGAGLWSQQPYKGIAADQKSAYATQMQFVACAQFQHGITTGLAARYTHPKYPSSAERWSQWLELLAMA